REGAPFLALLARSGPGQRHRNSGCTGGADLHLQYLPAVDSHYAGLAEGPPLPIYRQPARKPLPGAQCLAALCETSLPPALSCLYRYDTYITIRTISLVQNVPRGTLVSYPGAASPRGSW